MINNNRARLNVTTEINIIFNITLSRTVSFKHIYECPGG